jgi:hypothetical protein
LLLALTSGFFGGVAEAQPPVQIQFGPSTPSMEFGAHTNFLEFFGDASRTIGGRFAKRHTEWLVSEFAYDRTSWKYEHRDTRLLILSARFQAPTPAAGKRPFISLGVARADGLSFEWSPMISAGAQAEAANGILAFRAEVQYFTRGRAPSFGGGLYTVDQRDQVQNNPFERARLVMGVAVGIP